MQYREAALRAALETDRVGVRKGRGDHALLVRERLDRADAVAQRGGLLEAKLLRRLLHSAAQSFDQFRALSFQDQRGLFDAAAVVLLRHVLETPSGAAAHLILQTGPVLADITREFPRAVRQQQGLADRGDDLARLIAPAERAVIARSILRSAAGERQLRIGTLKIDADEGITLVVLEQDIVVRPVALDQRVFQHERFEFAVSDDHVEIAHLVDHRRHLRQMLAAEVADDAVFQPLGLADVDDLALFVEHDIHARKLRQIIRFFQKRIKHVSFPLLLLYRYTRS